MVEALATIMVWLGFPDMARYRVLMVDILRRPSEVLRLRCRQIIPPVRSEGKSYIQVALHLRPDYYGIRSKTAEIDDSVLIDRPEMGVLMEEW